MCMARSKLKNITLSADETILARARECAAERERSLNELFREWLEDFTRPLMGAEEFSALMEKVSYARHGRKFSRDEMNER